MKCKVNMFFADIVESQNIALLHKQIGECDKILEVKICFSFIKEKYENKSKNQPLIIQKSSARLSFIFIIFYQNLYFLCLKIFFQLLHFSCLVQNSFLSTLFVFFNVRFDIASRYFNVIFQSNLMKSEIQILLTFFDVASKFF